jgi:hypothetical protein
MGAKFLAENKEASTKVVATILDDNANDNVNPTTVELLGLELNTGSWSVGSGWTDAGGGVFTH